jgi:hypothetical protein
LNSASRGYQQPLADHGIHPSMSRKGNCYDNACVKSFFGTLKNELVHERRYRTPDETRRDVFEYDGSIGSDSIDPFSGNRALSTTNQSSLTH